MLEMDTQGNFIVQSNSTNEVSSTSNDMSSIESSNTVVHNDNMVEQQKYTSSESVATSVSSRSEMGIRIPIIGYEVMEERARFTIYKLKIEDLQAKKSWLVFRRYTDFVRLFNRLKCAYKDFKLRLPGKRWFGDNFESSFLEERARSLQIFVNNILKLYIDDSCVREFFCLDEPPQSVDCSENLNDSLENTVYMLNSQLLHKDRTILCLSRRVNELECLMAECQLCRDRIK